MNWHKDHILNHPLFNTIGIVNDPSFLYPPFREKIQRLIVIATESGLNVGLYETYRSQARQLALFKQRKTKIKINGMHHYGVAADIVFTTPGGGWTWTPRNGASDWKRLGQICKDLGLVWGGDWRGLVDCPHLQFVSVAEQDAIRRGEYPAAPADSLETEYDIPIRQAALAVRRDIVRQLSAVYQLTMKPEARISRETMSKLNGFRYSVELKDIKLEG